MLEAVRDSDIIVGAYTDRGGGVCPMLAAHRRGGRTNFISFARAWDRFASADGRARRASERELRVLTSQLEASLMAEEQVDLSQAIDEHAALLRRQPAPAPTRPGDPDRTEELRARSGWAWLRPFRRYDDYVRALDRAESASAEHAAERGLVEA
ncbi:MAG: hypothetical protein QOK04_2318 [Solirubrobacteraceae bacterium]|jgi:hypothetical protein|nr:hypothetical protein [Solirubrobacteraceae bacterium]